VRFVDSDFLRTGDDGGGESRTFKTLTIRLARLTVNGFLENADLVIRTLGEFGEEAAAAHH
jgi:hypothetical protein